MEARRAACLLRCETTRSICRCRLYEPVPDDQISSAGSPAASFFSNFLRMLTESAPSASISATESHLERRYE